VDAKSSLGDAKSSLGDAESTLGDAESSLGDAESSLGALQMRLTACLIRASNRRSASPSPAHMTRVHTTHARQGWATAWSSRCCYPQLNF
jgi:hypothetical protein